jgi:general secretion pathway protein I
MIDTKFNNQHGFTLLEVMVAVAILAFALSAMVKMTGESSNTLSYLEKKTYGQWVALNQVNEMEAQASWPSSGRSQGDAKMAGLDWSWEIEVKDTDAEDLRRLDIAVKQDKDDDQAIYQLTAFIHKP